MDFFLVGPKLYNLNKIFIVNKFTMKEGKLKLYPREIISSKNFNYLEFDCLSTCPITRVIKKVYFIN